MKIKEDQNKVSEFVSRLFHVRIQAHILHLQVTGVGSFAQHSALDGLYNGIVGLTDDLVEAYQGKHGIIKGYKLDDVYDYSTKEECIKYLSDLHDYIDSTRTAVCSDSLWGTCLVCYQSARMAREGMCVSRLIHEDIARHHSRPVPVNADLGHHSRTVIFSAPLPNGSWHQGV